MRLHSRNLWLQLESRRHRLSCNVFCRRLPSPVPQRSWLVPSSRATMMMPSTSCSRRRKLSSSHRLTWEERLSTYCPIWISLQKPNFKWLSDVASPDGPALALYSLVIQAVETMSIFEDACLASYFISNEGQKTAMFKVVDQALGKVVWSGPGPFVSEPELQKLV